MAMKGRRVKVNTNGAVKKKVAEQPDPVAQAEVIEASAEAPVAQVEYVEPSPLNFKPLTPEDLIAFSLSVHQQAIRDYKALTLDWVQRNIDAFTKAKKEFEDMDTSVAHMRKAVIDSLQIK